MFSPIRYDSGKLVKLLTAESTTISKGDALDFASGYAQRATSSSTDIHYVALEDVTTGAGEHKEVLCVNTDGVEVEGDTTGNTSQALVGTYIDLTDQSTLNEAASTTNVFYVQSIVGAAADKKVRGYFVRNVA